jgi:hypothetical protein
MRRNLASGLVTCGLVLLVVGCKDQPKTRIASTSEDDLAAMDTTLAEDPGDVVRPLAAISRELQCGGTFTPWKSLEVTAPNGGKLGLDNDTLYISPGVVSQGTITFKLRRQRQGVIQVVREGGGQFGEPTYGGPRFTLLVNFAGCEDTAPGVALHRRDDDSLVLPVLIKDHEWVRVQLRDLSTYAVAAPGYSGMRPLVLPPDSTADTSASIR